MTNYKDEAEIIKMTGSAEPVPIDVSTHGRRHEPGDGLVPQADKLIVPVTELLHQTALSPDCMIRKGVGWSESSKTIYAGPGTAFAKFQQTRRFQYKSPVRTAVYQGTRLVGIVPANQLVEVISNREELFFVETLFEGVPEFTLTGLVNGIYAGPQSLTGVWVVPPTERAWEKLMFRIVLVDNAGLFGELRLTWQDPTYPIYARRLATIINVTTGTYTIVVPAVDPSGREIRLDYGNVRLSFIIPAGANFTITDSWATMGIEEFENPFLYQGIPGTLVPFTFWTSGREATMETGI